MVMVEGSDGHLWYRVSNNGAWKAWREFGAEVSSSPSLVKSADGKIHIFARGLDSNLWSVTGKNASWTAWKNLGGNLSSAPSAVPTDERDHRSFWSGF